MYLRIPKQALPIMLKVEISSLPERISAADPAGSRHLWL